MFKFIKRVRKEMKKEAELKKCLTRLAQQPLDYEMLQTLIDATANTNHSVEMKIILSDGTNIELKPLERKGVDFVSFKERYEKSRV